MKGLDASDSSRGGDDEAAQRSQEVPPPTKEPTINAHPPAPEYRFPTDRTTSQPRCIARRAAENSRGGLARWGKSRRGQFYFWRKAIWSPDGGSHILTQSEDHHIEIFRVVSSSPDGTSHTEQIARDAADFPLALSKTLTWKAPSPIIEVAWYPYANFNAQDGSEGSASASWMFLISCRDIPIRLVDAFTGKMRSTYGIESHTETFLSAHAFALSLVAPTSESTNTQEPSRLLLYAGLSSSSALAIIDLFAHTGTNLGGRLSLGLKAGHSAARAMHLRSASAGDVQPPKRRRVAETEPEDSSGGGKNGAIGQRGIISATALSFDTATKSTSSDPTTGEAAGEEIIALGTLDGNIGIYSTAWLRYLASSHQQGPWDPHKMEALETIGLNAALSGWKAGLPPSGRKTDASGNENEEAEADAAISQLAFHPTAPYFLFVSQRRFKDRVIVYDTRYLPRRSAEGEATDGVLDFERYPGEEAIAAVLCISSLGEMDGRTNVRGEGEKEEYSTNQRIFFDVDFAGRWLVCGGTAPGRGTAERETSEAGAGELMGDGWVHVWDISEDALLLRPSSASDAGHSTKAKCKAPHFSFRAHDDVVSSCAFHPFYPMLLTTSGSRHFPATKEDVQSESSDESAESKESSGDEQSDTSSGSGSESEEDAPSITSTVQEVEPAAVITGANKRGGTPLTKRVLAEQDESKALSGRACMKIWDLR